MIKSLKTFFLTRLLREKFLLVAFIALGVVIWASGFSKRAGTFWTQQRTLQTTLADQDGWLGKRAAIDARAQQAISKLEPAKTLNDARLLGEIGSIMKEAGVEPRNFFTAEQRSERTPQFAVNSLRLSVVHSTDTTMEKVYAELQKRSPYIGIEEFSVQIDPQDRIRLRNYQVKLSSVEVLR